MSNSSSNSMTGFDMAFKNWKNKTPKRMPEDGTLAHKVLNAPLMQAKGNSMKVFDITTDVDNIATELDSKWGVERFVDQCPDIDLKHRFLAQRLKFDRALFNSDNMDELKAHAQSLIKGYLALDKAMMNAGMRTAAECGYLEILRDDRVWRFVGLSKELKREPDDQRHITFVAIGSCVDMYMNEENQLLAEVTKTFEGSLIQRASSRKDKDPDDCIKDIFPI